jgi:hypothetical protein
MDETTKRSVYVEKWRSNQALDTLCRWCRRRLFGEEKYYCCEDCHQKFNAYQRKWKKQRTKDKRSAKGEPNVFDDAGNEYKVVAKRLLNNYQIAMMTEEELEQAKKNLRRRFNVTVMREEGLAFLKVKKIEAMEGDGSEES